MKYVRSFLQDVWDGIMVVVSEWPWLLIGYINLVTFLIMWNCR
jgi:hypothetical protein